MILCSIFLRGLFGLETNLGWEAWGIFAVAAIIAVPVMMIMRSTIKWVNDKLFDKYIVKILKKLPSPSNGIEKKKKARERKLISK
jgi:hypothetical protein